MLGLSCKIKYAMLALLELARYDGQGPVQIRSISERHGIPQKYLEQVLMSLKQAGLLRSFRGSQGGYELEQSAEEIMVSDVMEAVLGPAQLADTRCDGELGFFWEQAQRQAMDIFNVSLADLLMRVRRENEVLTYSI